MEGIATPAMQARNDRLLKGIAKALSVTAGAVPALPKGEPRVALAMTELFLAMTQIHYGFKITFANGMPAGEILK